MGRSDMLLAVKWLSTAANEGLADAQWLLGLLYRDGKVHENGQHDHEKAIELFTAAAEKNSARGRFYLGLMHEYGLGTEQDFKEAAALYTSASKQQDSDAMYHLGLMYAYGRGVDQDFQQALLLFKDAA